jgi:hypothetical protein
MPFGKYATAFPPEVLNAMTVAFDIAAQAAKGPLSDMAKQAMEDRILECAASGVFDVAKLTKAARGEGCGEIELLASQEP